MADVSDCKCFSPTPSLPFADCYDQDTSSSFEIGGGGWGYCQKPGYFMEGMRSGSDGSVV